MRLATLILALILMLVLGAQSCAIAVGGRIAENLSTAAEDKEEAKDLAGAGTLGLLATLLWLIGAALVMAKPKVSMWLFGVAAVVCVLGAAAGFSDLYVWAVVSVVFALMSWRGAREKERDDDAKRIRYEADVEAAADRRTGEAPQPPTP